MSIKLDKLGADRDRALRKRDEWDAKYKELDRLYKERNPRHRTRRKPDT